MQRIRPPAVDGLFYPERPEELEEAVLHYLGSAPSGEAIVPKALIAPHAGYRYSGPVAGSAYARLAPLRSTVTRVVLLGPSHRVHVRGLAAPTADHFATPLGLVPVDRTTIDTWSALPYVRRNDAAHAEEHGLEVQLPFLQLVLDRFSIVPLVVGDASPEDVAHLLEEAWGGDETLIVISSDLSHYLSYEAAQQMDARTSQAIVALQPDAIASDQACGQIPLQALLLVARRKGLTAQVLDVRNSGDTSGSKAQVVGYGAYAFK